MVTFSVRVVQLLDEADDSHSSESHDHRQPGYVRWNVSEDNADDESYNKAHYEMECLVEATFVRTECHLCLIVKIMEKITIRIAPNTETKITQSEGRRKSLSLWVSCCKEAADWAERFTVFCSSTAAVSLVACSVDTFAFAVSMDNDLGAARESGCTESGGKNSTLIFDKSSSREAEMRERISSFESVETDPAAETEVVSEYWMADCFEDRHEHIADVSNMVRKIIERKRFIDRSIRI